MITLTAAATILGFNVGGTGVDGPVYAVLRLSTGKLLVGGRFYSYNGQDVPDGVARLNADGTVDNTFNSSGTGISGGSTYGPKIRALVEQSDGKLIIGGAFSTYNGTDVPDGLISLSSTGAYDNTFNGVQLGFRIQNSTSFTPWPCKPLVGGLFTSYNGTTSPRGLLRLRSTGAYDNTFNTNQAGVTGGTYYSLQVRVIAFRCGRWRCRPMAKSW